MVDLLVRLSNKLSAMSMLADIPLYQRGQVRMLADHLTEKRRFIQIVMRPRQVCETTIVRQVLARLQGPQCRCLRMSLR